MSRIQDSLIPKSTLFIMLASFLAVMIPHYTNVTPWLAVASGLMGGWRLAIYMGWVAYPSTRIKTALVVLAVSAFYLTYRHQFSVETAVAFFVLSVSLKLIEVRFAKDCYLFVFILLYLCACQFLFSQTFFTALYQITTALVVLWVLFSLHKGAIRIPKRIRIIEWLKLVLVAVPLVIAIFMFFPRIAPLWSIPLSTGKAYTGISDSMSPGQIADLTQSSARAFRVEFSGPVPSQSELYWRGLELDLLEGDTWRSSERVINSVVGRINEIRSLDTGAQPSYTVLIEPTDKRWAYALKQSEIASNNIYYNERGYVRFNNNIIQPTRYKLTYSPLRTETITDEAQNSEQRFSHVLNPRDRRRYLQLPNSGNPRTRAFVSSLESKGFSSEAFVQYIMNYFREQPFHYTLRPPRTGSAFFDEFIFDTQKGFCAHYAGSLVYMLRLAGIPSRVVIGYQGGEINEQDGYLMVHQYDAHAWVDVWLQNQGWVRYDPTAMVAPDRIERGLEEAVRDEGTFLASSTFSTARYNQFEMVRWMRLRMDAINYNWQKWVVGYDGQTQQNILSQWFGQVSFKSLAVILAVISGVIVIIAFLLLGYSKKQRSSDKVVIEFERLTRALEKTGVKRAVGETPRQFTDRLSVRFPQHKQQIDYLLKTFYLLQYGGVSHNAERLKLIKQLKVLRRSLIRRIKHSHR